MKTDRKLPNLRISVKPDLVSLSTKTGGKRTGQIPVEWHEKPDIFVSQRWSPEIERQLLRMCCYEK